MKVHSGILGIKSRSVSATRWAINSKAGKVLGLRRSIQTCCVLMQEAVDKKVLEEPNQMAIASADANGVPSVRMVLLKGYDERGFMFYTNYNSRKAQELANGHAALCMYWEPLQRQVTSLTWTSM